MVCEYKLINYKVPNWTDTIKMILVIGQVEFEEEAFPVVNERPVLPLEVKARLPWGQVPVLEYKGKQLAQMQSICRFLARKFNLTGKDEWECAKCDEIADTLNDLEQGLMPLYSAAQEERAQVLLDMKQNVFPKFLGRFDSMASDNGGQHLVGHSLTWADLFFVSVVNFIEAYFQSPALLEGYPHLQQISHNVHTVPQLVKGFK